MIRFSEMHGAGNDFVVIDAISQSIQVNEVDWHQVADRHFGVGADQILIVEKPHNPAHDFRYRIFNADGAEVEQCGNGARCFVRFVHDQGLTRKRRITVETLAGLIEPELLDDGSVKVNMGAPSFDTRGIGFVDWEAAGTIGQACVEAGIEHVQLASPAPQHLPSLRIELLSMGNPHAVQLVDDVDAAPVATVGPWVEGHPRFPRRVNAGFMQVVSRGHIRLRVYERGAGETLACGTGACAAVVAGIRLGLLDHEVDVDTRGGGLRIAWSGDPAAPVFMTGPATTVFHGEIELPELPGGRP